MIGAAAVAREEVGEAATALGLVLAAALVQVAAVRQRVRQVMISRAAHAQHGRQAHRDTTFALQQRNGFLEFVG